MKKLFYLSGIAICLIGCQETSNKQKVSQDNTESNNLIIIVGEIINPMGDYVAISGHDSDDSATVNTEGRFRLTMTLPEEGYYSFHHGNQLSTIYLSSGDSLYLNLDTKSFDETISYEGRGSVTNNYMADKYRAEKVFNMDFKSKISSTHLKDLDVNKEVLLLHDSIEDVYLTLLKKAYDENSGMSEKFYVYENETVPYYIASLKLEFANQMIVRENGKKHLPSNYFDFLDDIILEKQDLLSSWDYQRFLDHYIRYRFYGPDYVPGYHIQENGGIKKIVGIVERNFKTDAIRDYLLYHPFLSEVKSGNAVGLDSLMNKYKELSGSGTHFVMVDSLYNSMRP